MKLHDNKTLFRQAIEFTAQEMGIPAIYVEKDYWVTFVLYEIFKSDIGSETIFKGGTSLLKCYRYIQRFSEDIDLVVLRREGESNNKLTTKIREISRIVSEKLTEVQVSGITQKMGMNRKTAHTYAKEFNGNYGQVKDTIIVEATWLGYYEPYTTQPISSFVFDMMMNRKQEHLAEEYGLLPFDAQVLEPRRTICEKIMSLVRFSYGENPIDDLKKKIRHSYDLHQLLKVEELLDFFNSQEFDKMLLKVANDDVVSFKNNNEWLENHPKDALIFANVEMVWEDLKEVYNGDFKFLVFGSQFPDDKEILATLQYIKSRIVDITWDVKIEGK